MAAKIISFVMTIGLFLAGILAVVILVGSIHYMIDQGRQEAHLDQQTAQSLTDKTPQRE